VNDKYRDTIRSFWRGDGEPLGDLAGRLTGSPDLYRRPGNHPWKSVNFVTAHDGFTLEDIVSYAHKHNGANGEQNRDGSDHNRSANYGVEGPTTRPDVVATRERQKRNLLATLLLSQGVRCSSAATSSAAPNKATTTPTARTTRSPGSPGLRARRTRRCWPLSADWWPRATPTGLPARPLSARRQPTGPGLAARRRRQDGRRRLERPRPPRPRPRPPGDAPPTTESPADNASIVDAPLALLLNAGHGAARFELPALDDAPARWTILLDTAAPAASPDRTVPGDGPVTIPGRCVILLQRQG
jgi:glycogen operon protein